MREIPHPLTIITAQSAKSAQPAGLLVSSFNTITLQPIPYVSFNLRLPSSTYDEIKQSNTFTASAITSVQLAKDFLLDKKDARYADALRRNVENNRGGRLKVGRGGLWWMKCQWAEEKSVVVGDHVVVVGRVVEGDHYGDFDDPRKVTALPLIYSKGRYRNAGLPAVSTGYPEDEP
ncbi:MAG: hypothetical protein Q9220_006870 [cf. Caloplaca sp. 1 TL-2023]